MHYLLVDEGIFQLLPHVLPEQLLAYVVLYCFDQLSEGATKKVWELGLTPPPPDDSDLFS